MDIKSSILSCTFELEDIEIIDHKNESEEKLETWNCDQCSLFFLEKNKLDEHKRKHSVPEIVECKYCKKRISSSEVNRECFINRKCETCEYKCSKCPQRFLRHSSLRNHEKKHSSPKKKRAISNNKNVNGGCIEKVALSKVAKRKRAENAALSKGMKRKRIEDSEEQLKGLTVNKVINVNKTTKKKLNPQAKARSSLDGDENSSMKIPKRLSFKSSKPAEQKSHSENSPVKPPKRLSLKTNKTTEEKNINLKYKQNTAAVNSQVASQTANMSSSDNVVNYKPFSCHVCGDTFASDSALLEHIKTHGENAAKHFKCKFCGDEFDDIYKMQYHLAICPLAEDELESSLKHVIPTKMSASFSAGSLSPRKRGRPKKVVESPLDQENSINESTPTSDIKGTSRKRKSEMLDTKKGLQSDIESSLSKKPKTSPLDRIDNIGTAKENMSEPLPNDVTDVTKENGLDDDDRKKVHQCPFPRCDFKFTREKALLCHMRNHSDDFDDSLKCHKCDIPFDDIHTLRLHIDTCKGIKEERDDDFSRSDYDSSPNRTFQRTKKEFVCNLCGKSYQSQEKLNRHLESCGSKFVCRICKDDFLNQPLLDEHFGSKHPPYTAYHCYICEEDFISELFLEIHQKSEHQQNLNTNLVQESIREKESTFTCSAVSETTYDTDSAFKKYTKKSNIPSTPVSTTCAKSKRIYTTSVAAQTGRNSDNVHTKPITVTTCRSVNRTSRVFWCPICLMSFDYRDVMQIHFREKHLVKYNDMYSCEICEIKMPVAEMMCYHLELHSSNLLSVNRFSKLIACVRQSKVGELKNLAVQIKSEEVSEDETSFQVEEAIEVDHLKTPEKVKSTKKINTLNEIVRNESSSRPKLKSEDSTVSYQNSTLIDLKLHEELKCPRSKYKLNQDDKNKVQDKVECLSVSEHSNKKTKLSKRIQSELNVVKPTRPLRSKVKVNYCLRDKAKKEQARKKVIHEKVSDAACVETKLLKEINYIHLQVNDSKATQAVTKENYSSIERGQSNEVQRRGSFSLTGFDIKSSPQLSADDKTHLENLVEPQLSPSNCKTEIIITEDDTILDPLTEKTKHMPCQAKKLKRNKCRSLQPRSKRYIKYLSPKTETNNEQLSKVNLNNSDISVTTKPIPINHNNSVNENNMPDSSVQSEHIDENPGLKFGLVERSIEQVTAIQSSPYLKEGPFDDVTNEIKVQEEKRDLQPGDLVDSPVSDHSENSDELVKEEESENLLSETKEQEESRTSSTGGSEGINCTMCSESFYNQDEFLDHLATHI